MVPKMLRGVPAGELIPPPMMVFTSSVISWTGLIRGAEGLNDPRGESFSFTPHSDPLRAVPRTRTTVETCRVAPCFLSAANYYLAMDPQYLFRTSSVNPMRTASSRVFTARHRGSTTASGSLARMSLNLASPLGTPRQICRTHILGYLALLTRGKSPYRPYEQPVRPTPVIHSTALS